MTRDLETINTFMFPHELDSVASCDIYINKYVRMRDSYQKLRGAPKKREHAKRCNARITAAQNKRAELELLAEI